MRFFSKTLRIIYVYLILLRYGLDDIILMTPWFKRFRFAKFFNPFLFFYVRKPRGLRLRLAIEKLGPIFIKFGQALSTRPDIFPPEIIAELSLLRDQVPPFSGEKARAIIEASLQQPISEIYVTFATQPLASASIAQVHAATLLSGEEVIVKVLRPSIDKVIRKDITILRFFARILQRYWSEGYRLKPLEIVNEFATTLDNELDLLREAANASQLKRNFNHSPLLYVPAVYWHYCSTQVMTMERINGLHVDDIKGLKAHGVDMKKLSERGVEIFFTQVFRDNFFHADMHPGNIFVSPEHPHDPQYIGVDFGIMGALSEDDKRYLAENFLAFFNHDYRRVAILHIESKWVPSNTRVEEFEGAIRAVCEPIFQRPLHEISFGQLLVRLFQIASQFKMPIQPQLVLLQKTLLNVEGLGRQLYPELDLWQTAKPFLEKWIKTQVGPRALFKKIKQQTPMWIDKLPELPGLLYNFLQQENLPAKQTRQNKKSRISRSFLFGIAFGLIAATVFIAIFKLKTQVTTLSIFAGAALICFLYAALLGND